MLHSCFFILNYSEKCNLNKYKSIVHIIDLTEDNILSPSHGGILVHRVKQVYNNAPSFVHFIRGFKVPLKYIDSDGNPIDKYFKVVDDLFLFKEFNPNPIKQSAYLFNSKRKFEYMYYISKTGEILKLKNISDINRITGKEFEEWIFTNINRRNEFLKLQRRIFESNTYNSICIISDTHETTFMRNVSFKIDEMEFTPEICLIELLVNYPRLDNCAWNYYV